jgi:hypothetical protein
MDALVITSRYTCCEGLSPEESKAVKSLDATDTWLQSIASLKRQQYPSYVKDLVEKQKNKPRFIVISDDVPQELTFMINDAFAKIQQDTFFLHKNGILKKI